LVGSVNTDRLGAYGRAVVGVGVIDDLQLTMTVAACQISNDLVLPIRSPKQDRAVFL
jgi:hypothetical protein